MVKSGITAPLVIYFIVVISNPQSNNILVYDNPYCKKLCFMLHCKFLAVEGQLLMGIIGLKDIENMNIDWA